MDVSDIEMLETIVKQGSVNRAAEQLNVTQSTLSKRLSRLEDRLGVTLFHRHPSGLTPTEASRYLIAEGQSLKGRLTAMSRHLQLMKDLKVGELRLGVGPIVEQLFFPDVLLRLSELTDHLPVSVSTDRPEFLLQQLREGAVDLVVGPFNRASVADDLYYQEIMHEANIAVARAEHPLLQDLPQWWPEDTSDVEFSALLRQHNIPTVLPNIPAAMEAQFPDGYYRPTIRCENYHTAKQLVLRSDYATAGPRSLFVDELAAGTLVQLPVAVPVEWTAAMVALPENQTAPLIRATMELFRELAAPFHQK